MKDKKNTEKVEKYFTFYLTRKHINDNILAKSEIYFIFSIDLNGGDYEKVFR